MLMVQQSDLHYIFLGNLFKYSPKRVLILNIQCFQHTHTHTHTPTPLSLCRELFCRYHSVQLPTSCNLMLLESRLVFLVLIPLLPDSESILPSYEPNISGIPTSPSLSACLDLTVLVRMACVPPSLSTGSSPSNAKAKCPFSLNSVKTNFHVGKLSMFQLILVVVRR